MSEARALHVLMREASDWARETTTPYAVSNLLLEIVEAFDSLPVSRTYYRSLKDGKIWCETRHPIEVLSRTLLEEGEIEYEKLETLETNTGWVRWAPDYAQLSAGRQAAEKLQQELED